MRREEEIFADLLALCGAPGYVHALGLLCYRDNYIRYRDEIRPQDMDHLFSRSRLIRTEITTLIGLLIRGPMEFSHPGLAVLLGYIERTEVLLRELHECLGAVMLDSMFGSEPKPGPHPRPELSAAALREPIFYGGESAYGFQYRELSEKKYGADDPWLLSHMGFSIGDARRVVGAVAAIQGRKVRSAHQALRSMPRPTSATMRVRSQTRAKSSPSSRARQR